jgi:radical SAM protein (TIGR01212 family)
VVCRLLGDLSRTHFISVELGLQSLNDETLRWMNRGHTAQVFFDALARLRQASEGRVHTGAHVVFGFPGDSISTAEEMATRLSEAKIDAVKVHNLHIVRGTPLESLHQSDTWKLPTRETYIQMVMAFLTHLDSRVVVQRLIADAPAESLVAPPWMGDKTSFLRDLEAAMRAKGVAQGSLRVPEKA